MSKICAPPDWLLPHAPYTRELALNLGLVRLLAFAIAQTGYFVSPTVLGGEKDIPCIPVVDSTGWWQVASNPDLGALTSAQQEPVDFGIWQAADGSWQLWSCIRKTREDGHGRLFHRWEGKRLTDCHWKPMGIVMRADPNCGEKVGGLQAPYVVKHGGEYWMFYGDWEHICVAHSKDGRNFERYPALRGCPQVFGEGAGNNARDPMLIPIAGTWYCYYSAMRAESGPRSEGGMFVRKSTDLLDWSRSTRKKILSGGAPGPLWYHAECPHVVYHEGYYYLFRTSNYKGDPKTTVYRSLDPTDFGIDDDKKIVATLPVAAPEIVADQGQLWLAALNPQLDGIRITSLTFLPDHSEAP